MSEIRPKSPTEWADYGEWSDLPYEGLQSRLEDSPHGHKTITVRLCVYSAIVVSDEVIAHGPIGEMAKALDACCKAAIEHARGLGLKGADVGADGCAPRSCAVVGDGRWPRRRGLGRPAVRGA